MKFGKQLHYERVSSGPLAEALPWIDYRCASAAPNSTTKSAVVTF